MPVDRRDELWKAAYETWYFASYNHRIAETLLSRWQRIDDFTKVIVAITASGSAISGWALWNVAGFKMVWIVIAALGAVLSVVGGALGIPTRLKIWGESKADFLGLQMDLETFRYEMSFDPEFEVHAFAERFVECRKRFAAALQRIKNDVLSTSRLARKCQSELNEQLGYLTMDQKGAVNERNKGNATSAATAATAQADEMAS